MNDTTTEGTTPLERARARFDSARDNFVAARDVYNQEHSEASRAALRRAYSGYFAAMEHLIQASPNSNEVRAYAVAAYTAAHYRARFGFEFAVGGSTANAAALTRFLEEFARAEKLYASLGYRLLTDEELKASVELPGVVAREAPTPFFDKILVPREPGEEPVFHGEAMLARWKAAGTEPASAASE